jgi:hypothetical protein
VDLLDGDLRTGIHAVFDDFLQDHRPQAITWAAHLLRQAVGVQEQGPIGADKLHLLGRSGPGALAAFPL